MWIALEYARKSKFLGVFSTKENAVAALMKQVKTDRYTVEATDDVVSVYNIFGFDGQVFKIEMDNPETVYIYKDLKRKWVNEDFIKDRKAA